MFYLHKYFQVNMNSSVVNNICLNWFAFMWDTTLLSHVMLNSVVV